MIKIYNINNHRLDSEKLTFLNTFNSDNFCGVALSPQGQNEYVSDVFQLSTTGTVVINPLLEDNDAVDNDGISILNSGTVLKLASSDYSITPESNNFYFIKYPVTYMQNENNIYSDICEEATFDHKQYTSYTSVYYDINGSVCEADSEAMVGVTSKIELADGTIINYSGQGFVTTFANDSTIYHIIPLFLYDGSRLVSLVEARNKSSLEHWLSARSLDDLWENLHKTFTHQAGSTDGNNYGKLADFDFSGSNVSHGDTIIITVDNDGNFIFPTYKSDTTNGFYIDPDGKLHAGKVPIVAGGTGADNKQDAKNNLGMYYGVLDPADYFSKNSMIAEEGDLYFKILD